jgi:hypothetical protein
MGQVYAKKQQPLPADRESGRKLRNKIFSKEEK